MRGQSLAAMPLRQAEAEVTRVQRDYRPMVKTVESYSPYRTFAGEIVQHLADEGLNLVQFGQGFLSMAAPTAELERLSVSRNLWHGGHPVLRWNASNVAVRHDPAGNIKPDKERSTERIDGIVAICNALGRAIARDVNAGRSVYETRGILML